MHQLRKKSLMRSTILTRPVALLIAVALGLVALAGLAPAGSAAAPALPDPTRTATLHVTKQEAPGTAAGNGTQQSTGRPPIAGVTFTIKKVGSINLATQAGWTAASDLAESFTSAAPTTIAAAEAAVTGGGHALGAAQSGTTDANGVVDFTGLPLGLYLVEETSVPAGVTPSAPFLVTLPMTHPTTTDTWMYDVYVYPKNARSGVTKEVADADSVKLGDPVVWTVRGDIPASTGSNDKVTGYLVTDRLDTKLTYDPAKPATAALSNGTSLVAGTDYEVLFDAATNTVRVRFLAPGLAKLSADRAATVIVTVPTTVNAVGEIENTATLYPNQPSADGETGGVPSNEVTTKWGSIDIKKVAPDGSALAGATFKVYTSLADAQAGTGAVSINGTDSWTSGANGELTIAGLRYSGWANGAAVQPGDPDFNQYYLVEVKAPSGYELLAEPIPFTVDATTTTVAIDRTIENVPTNGGFQLPFTGGAGAWLVYLAGGLLVGAALLLAVSRRRSA